MNEKYRNIEDIYDNYNDITPQYDEKESFKEDTDLDETLPETFEGKIDFLAADEEEAIEGYDKVLLALTDKKYEHIRKQLEIIRDEEVAHKEFLEKAINDLKAIYVDPSENRDDVVDLEEEKKLNKEILTEMSIQRKDAIILCTGLGKQFIKHFDKIISEPKSQAVNHWIDEMQNWYDQVCKLTLKPEAKKLDRTAINDWFLTVGSEPSEYLNNDEKVSAYDNFCNKLLINNSVKQSLIDTDVIEEALILKEKKISKSPIYSYIYKGPIYKNGFLCSEYWEGETQAISEAQALNNLRFQAGKYLGYNVGSHRVKMYLKPENLYKLENIDDYYDSYEDIEPIKQCDKCDALLSDNGNCPVCDDGEEDYK